MKKIFLFFLGSLLFGSVFAQTPGSFSYQAIVRNGSGGALGDQPVSCRFSIIIGDPAGTAVYQEKHGVTTNQFGLITLAIGNGTDKTGDLSAIDWGLDKYYLKVEIDPAGGATYTDMGTTQLLSVPYALYANNVNLRKDGKPLNLYIKEDGSLIAVPIISVEKPYGAVPSVTDADGNTYETVKIGTQIWMAENLKTTKFNDGADIPNVIVNTEWAALTTPAYCWFTNNEAAFKNKYGALYNWYTVSTNKLCPTGWHVSADTEWTTLITYLGSLASGRAKESGTSNWQVPNNDATNDSKFTALPGGFCSSIGSFSGAGGNGYWWSSTEYPLNDAWYLTMDYNTTTVYKYKDVKRIGFSVRCIMD